MLDEIEGQCPQNPLRSKLAKACRIEPYPAPPRDGPLSRGTGKRQTWLNRVLDIYVACFSTRNDILSQWKNYACGGAGFAIGFDRHGLAKAVQPPASWRCFTAASVNLVPVRYSLDTQKRELLDIFDQFCSAISETASPSEISCCADEIVNALALHASLFKDPCFRDEDEWRIIIETMPGRSDLRFRSSADKVIPYMETPEQEGGRLPVVSISIGAAMDQEAATGGVRALLDAKGYRRSVRVTEIGLRPSVADLGH